MGNKFFHAETHCFFDELLAKRLGVMLNRSHISIF
jgi:hypothetical protein